MLEVHGLHARYGKSHVLHGVSLQVKEGEIAALLGRNGAGKTTTLKSISGLLPPIEGRISCLGTEVQGWAPHSIARHGACLVPEHRGIFTLLSVEENLQIAQRPTAQWSIQDVYRLFPRLHERRKNGGGMLSGGEQQMLAIARALVNGPRILMLDEPTEGLAPVIVNEIVETLKTIRQSGMAILLVEQNLRVCERLADHVFILEQGRMVHASDVANFRHATDVKTKYLTAAAVNEEK